MTLYMHLVMSAWNTLMTVGSVVGLMILEYSVLDGIFMVWDKLVHGQPFFESY